MEKTTLKGLALQEYNTMKDEKCLACGGPIQGTKIVSPGFGGSALMWRCPNIECDQYDIKKTDTQMGSKRYLNKKESVVR